MQILKSAVQKYIQFAHKYLNVSPWRFLLNYYEFYVYVKKSGYVDFDVYVWPIQYVEKPHLIATPCILERYLIAETAIKTY